MRRMPFGTIGPSTSKGRNAIGTPTCLAAVAAYSSRRNGKEIAAARMAATAAFARKSDAISRIVSRQQQEDADRNRAHRKDDAADPGGALEGGRDNDGQQRNEAPAPRRGKPRQDDHRKNDATRGCQMLRNPARLEDPAVGRLILGQRAAEKIRRERQRKNRAKRRGEAQHHDQERRQASPAEPNCKPHHQCQRGVGGEPGQRDIGFPPACSRRGG